MSDVPQPDTDDQPDPVEGDEPIEAEGDDTEGNDTGDGNQPA